MAKKLDTLLQDVADGLQKRGLSSLAREIEQHKGRGSNPLTEDSLAQLLVEAIAGDRR